MDESIIIDENGYLYLEGRVLLVGDIVELNFGTSDWFIGQVEQIGSEFRISVFEPGGGHLLFSRNDNPIRAKRLVNRPTFLPPFGEDWPRRPRPHETYLLKKPSGEIEEWTVYSEYTYDDDFFPSVTAIAKPVMDKLEGKIYFWDLQIICPHCGKTHKYIYPESGNPTPLEDLGYFEAHCDGPGFFVIIGEVLQ